MSCSAEYGLSWNVIALTWYIHHIALKLNILITFLYVYKREYSAIAWAH